MSILPSVNGWNPAYPVAMPGDQPVRVLIVDDSAVMRSFLERLFAARADIDIVGTLPTATQAFDFLGRERVDIILLDHEMPGQKGLEALPRMMEAGQGAHVVMLSSHCQRGSKVAVTALSMGASDALPKPSRTYPVSAFVEALVERFRRLAAARRRSVGGRTDHRLRIFPPGFCLNCLGIGASTGGIRTLAALFAGLNGDALGVPVLVTQHLPEAFIPYYAQQVARMTDLPVSIARPDQPILPDHVYIAPGDHSLSCRRDSDGVRIALADQHDLLTGTRPSVNAMFTGMAECYGAGALGIVLTGIGRDGTAGAGRIVEAGGAVIAQDEESSVVWGMPGSVTRAGLACATLHPEKMSEYVRAQAGRR